MRKRLNFDHIIKWYIHEQEPVNVNETDKILWDFEIKTDNLRLINKKQKNITHCQVDPIVLADHKVKMKESEKIMKYLDFAREL